ncbi:hypothetical protein, conserved [Leishmania tarentolae]|uniref:Uncharacterized protein n=1 Tax=Leishmania tarentolae TaxID=5689 RepID=A0A640KUW8_LEITA|nr:hypothetical protein, conserved [Leishmania tarentolae]
MNALGSRFRSVIVLVNTAFYTNPLLDEGCGHHCGCVVVSSDGTVLVSDIVRHVEHFCEENNISYRIIMVSEKATEIVEMMSASSTVEDWLTSPLTVIDCTPAVKEELRVASLLAWLHGTCPWAASREESTAKAHHTLVAVLDTARAVPCPPPITANSSAGGVALSWLRPTPSYYSELKESVGSSAENCLVLPVHMYSRYPALRGGGLREKGSDGGATAPVPLSAWTDKCTLSALLRELAFKAGQLAKYGA